MNRFAGLSLWVAVIRRSLGKTMAFVDSHPSRQLGANSPFLTSSSPNCRLPCWLRVSLAFVSFFAVDWSPRETTTFASASLDRTVKVRAVHTLRASRDGNLLVSSPLLQLSRVFGRNAICARCACVSWSAFSPTLTSCFAVLLRPQLCRACCRFVV